MIETISVGSCPAEPVRLPGNNDSRLVIYYYGGDFLFGLSRSHRAIATHLAKASGAIVLSVDYRLAPEHPALTAHDDSFAAYG